MAAYSTIRCGGDNIDDYFRDYEGTKIHHGVCHSCPNKGRETTCNNCYYKMGDPYVKYNIHNLFKYTNSSPKQSMESSFDSIILECSDLLSVETEVKKAYAKWVKKNTKKITIEKDPGSNINIKRVIWYFLSGTSIFSISVILLWLFSSAMGIWLWVFVIVSILSGTVSSIGSGIIICAIKYDHFKIKLNQKSPENSKLLFLKEAYVGTITNLNTRLDKIKDRLEKQIRLHKEDREQVLQYSHILTNTEEVVQKIDAAVQTLNDSFDKVSSKKAEINQFLEEYIGKNGYISQKEKELEDLKIAQELSDRMQTNFKVTMELTKDVDILTSTIIPGIKRLMEFKISELIDKVEFECDKNSVLLEMKN